MFWFWRFGAELEEGPAGGSVWLWCETVFDCGVLHAVIAMGSRGRAACPSAPWERRRLRTPAESTRVTPAAAGSTHGRRQRQTWHQRHEQVGASFHLLPSPEGWQLVWISASGRKEEGAGRAASEVQGSLADLCPHLTGRSFPTTPTPL